MSFLNSEEDWKSIAKVISQLVIVLLNSEEDWKKVKLSTLSTKLSPILNSEEDWKG